MRWFYAVLAVRGAFGTTVASCRKTARGICVLVGLSCLAAFAEDARAAPPVALPFGAEEAGAEACQAAGAAREAGDGAAINELFTEFHCWLSIQRYRPALAALENACGLADEPECLFDRAYVHHALIEVEPDREAENCRISRENYERYLARDPYDTYCDEARSALDELNKICAPAPRPASLPVKWDPDVIGPIDSGASPPDVSGGRLVSLDGTGQVGGRAREAPPVSEGAELRAAAPWLLLGGGAATGVVTGVLLGYMFRADSELVARQSDGKAPGGEDRALDHNRVVYRDWALVLGGSTALLLGAGVTLLVLDAGPESILSFGAPGGLPGVSYGGVF